MKKTKKKLKKVLANMLLYTAVWGMWTSLMIFGFMQNTSYQILKLFKINLIQEMFLLQKKLHLQQ